MIIEPVGPEAFVTQFFEGFIGVALRLLDRTVDDGLRHIVRLSALDDELQRLIRLWIGVAASGCRIELTPNLA